VIALTDQARNIDAIGRYISEQSTARTAAAAGWRDQWQAFYSSLGSVEFNYEQQAYDRARNIRLQYNLANATTDAERAAVMTQATEGLSTEEVNGEPDRRRTDGTYVPPPSGSATLAHVALGAGAVVALLLFLRR
jgi:hypothetical protein